jgi:hypothetical protein
VLEMSDLLQTVGCLVAKVCDAHCHRQLFGNNTTNASTGGSTTTTTTTTSSSTTTTTTATQMIGIEHAIRNSRSAKARLLHYFAATPSPLAADGNADGAVVESSSGEEDNDYDYSSWCAWHNDHVSAREKTIRWMVRHQWHVFALCTLTKFIH